MHKGSWLSRCKWIQSNEDFWRRQTFVSSETDYYSNIIVIQKNINRKFTERNWVVKFYKMVCARYFKDIFIIIMNYMITMKTSFDRCYPFFKLRHFRFILIVLPDCKLNPMVWWVIKLTRVSPKTVLQLLSSCVSNARWEFYTWFQSMKYVFAFLKSYRRNSSLVTLIWLTDGRI